MNRSSLLAEDHVWRAELPAHQPALDQLLQRFEAVARGQRIPATVRRDLHLVLDEIIENVIMHGAERTRVRVSVVLRLGADRAWLQISDNGRAFNPVAAPLPGGSIRNRPIGGLGLLLVRSLMDRVTYSRRDGWNRLRVTRLFVRPPQRASLGQTAARTRVVRPDRARES